ncbi:GGDEF domain-containing protein [Marinobacter sp.]|uniref:GGDEF domain-containing protein n=1 Tax=Marinobacter sp. TaxID=50741 RepID=UPI002B269ED3|nr:GGDEF domain-containing protein [Marinobacter sp.]
MDMSNRPDLGKTLKQSRSGLRDNDRRSLARVMFWVTGLAFMVFAGLQLFSGYPWVTVAEVIIGSLSFLGAVKINHTPYLERWVYGYLLTLFSIFIGIMLLPNVSMAAFVWVLMMPALAYLLLGRREGMMLSVPFMLLGCAVYYFYLGTLGTADAMIDLLNMVLCGGLMQVFMHMYEARREEAEQRLIEVAQTDALTGLANRGNFQSTLTRTIAESERSNTAFVLVMMDLDHFKVVNDTLGHDAGDFVLQEIGKCLRERLRTTDFVGRLGGEEFGLILRDVQPTAAYELIEELRQRIAGRKLSYGDSDINVTASFGMAQWPENGRQADILFSVADQHLYRGKRAGRNQVVSSFAELSNSSAGSLAGGMG